MSISLAHLAHHTPARVSAIHATGDLLARMLSWGIIVNSPIEIIRRGPFRGPLQVQLGHIHLMVPASLIASIEVTSA